MKMERLALNQAILSARGANESNHPKKMKFDGVDRRFPIELFITMMEHLEAIQDLESLAEFARNNLSEKIWTEMKENNFSESWRLAREFLVNTYGKKSRFELADCLHLLSSLVKKSDEDPLEYLIRVKFCVDQVEAVSRSTDNSLLKLLYLQGLTLPLSDVETQLDDLLHDIDRNLLILRTKDVKQEKPESQSSPDVEEERDVLSRDPLEYSPQVKICVEDNELKLPDLNEVIIKDEEQTEIVSDAENSVPDLALVKKPRRNFKKQGIETTRHSKSKNVDSLDQVNWKNPMFCQVMKGAKRMEKSYYLCAICVKQSKGDWIQGLGAYKEHVQARHNGNSFICDCCDFVTNASTKLARHRLNVHNKVMDTQEVLRCPKVGCLKQYVTRRDLNVHISQSHKKLKSLSDADDSELKPKVKKVKREPSRSRGKGIKFYVNSLDQVNWENPMVYQVIPKKEKRDKPVYICAICVKEGKRDMIYGMIEFKKHVSDQHNGKSVACDCCDYTANNSVRLARHRFDVHGRVTDNFEVLSCPRDGCTKQCVTKATLNSHIKLAHDKLYTPGVCPVCGKVFGNKNSIKHHIQLVHEKMRKFACDQCDKTYQLELALKQHKISAHGEDGDQFQTVCETCGKVCRNKYMMQQHIKRDHDKELRHVCADCGKRFFTPSQLTRHQRAVHEKGSEFVCPHCKTYKQSAHALRKHIEHSHLNKRQFHCKECDSWFTTSRSLSRHIAVRHLGIPWKDAQNADGHKLAKASSAFEKVNEEDAKTFDPVNRGRFKRKQKLSEELD